MPLRRAAARLKSHVGTVTDEEAALVYAIRAVTYTMMGAESAGVIAQELERVFPRAVRTRPTGVKSVDYQQVKHAPSSRGATPRAPRVPSRGNKIKIK